MAWEYLLPAIFGYMFKKEIDRGHKQQHYMNDPAVIQQEKWNEFYANREEEWRTQDLTRAQNWRNEDIARETQWRAEDINRNSLAYRMGELKDAGLHPALATGAGWGAGLTGTNQAKTAPMTGAGGRVPRPVPTSEQMSPIEQANSLSHMLMQHAETKRINADADLIQAEANIKKKELEGWDEYRRTELKHLTAQINELNSVKNLNEKKKEELEEYIIQLKRDNRIISEGNKYILSRSAGLYDIAADLIRAGQPRDVVEEVLKSFGTPVDAIKDAIDSFNEWSEKNFRGTPLLPRARSIPHPSGTGSRGKY